AILAAQQYLRDQAVLERVRRAPFARDHGVVAKMPPRVVGKLLRSAIHLPAAERLEALVVHHENAAGRLAVFVAECRHIDSARAAVGRVRTRVSRLIGDFRRFDRLHKLRFAWVWLGIEDVDARRTKTRHNKVATLDM